MEINLSNKITRIILFYLKRGLKNTVKVEEKEECKEAIAVMEELYLASMEG